MVPHSWQLKGKEARVALAVLHTAPASSSFDEIMHLYQSMMEVMTASDDEYQDQELQLDGEIDYLEIDKLVKASFMTLQIFMISGRHVVEKVEQWIRGVGLPVVRSGHEELLSVCDFIGYAIQTIATKCQEEESVQSFLEDATLLLLDDIVSSRGREHGCSVILSARVRWIASFLDTRGKIGQVSVRLIKHCLVTIRKHSASHSLIVRTIFPSLLHCVEKDTEMQRELWALMLEIEGRPSLEDKRNAQTMLCIFYEPFRNLLDRDQSNELWRTVFRGLSCHACSLIRKRALYILGLEVERMCSKADVKEEHFLLWWTRYIQAYDTLENVSQTHLLHQVYPVCVMLMEEAFAVGKEMQNEDKASLSPAWGEVLLKRALANTNSTIQRTYLSFIITQESFYGEHEDVKSEEQGEACFSIHQLSQDFILQHLLPALSNLHDIRDDREGFMRRVGLFLLRYATGLASEAQQRDFLGGLMLYCRDTNSALVRWTILGAIEHRDLLMAIRPCFGPDEVELLRSLVVSLREHNQRVCLRLSELLFAYIEYLVDVKAITSSPRGSDTIRALLVDLPLKLSLGESHARRITLWLQTFDEGSSSLGQWWEQATASAFRSFFGGSACHPAACKGEAAGCALACFFLPGSCDFLNVLEPVVLVWGRLQSYPYVPAASILEALSIFCAVGELVKIRDHPTLRQILQRYASATMVDHLAVTLNERILFAEAAAERQDKDKAEEEARTFDIYKNTLGSVVRLATDLGYVSKAIMTLLDACVDAIGRDEEKPPLRLTVARCRAVATVRSILENLLQSKSKVLYACVAERFAVLKDCLITAASCTALDIHSKLESSIPVHVKEVWRCRALLYKIQIEAHKERHQHPNIKDKAGMMEALIDPKFEIESLVSALESASAEFIPDVVFCMSCLIIPYIFWPSSVTAKQERLDSLVDSLIFCLEECNYSIHLTLLTLEMIFCPSILSQAELCKDENGPVRRFFMYLIDVGALKRNQILVDTTARCLQVLQQVEPEAECFFDREFVRLLTLKERDESVYHRSDEEGAAERTVLLKGDEESLPQLNPPIVRIALLYFLREVFKCGRQQALLRRIVMSLFAVSDSVELRKAQMLGSPAFCVKLRCWQSLCVLAPFLSEEEMPTINDLLYKAIRTVGLPAIRHHQELFTARLCTMYPDTCIPLLLRCLSDVDIRPQVSSSLFIVVGMICLSDNTVVAEGQGLLPSSFAVPLLKVILPWLSGTHVTTRIISQLVVHDLLSRILDEDLLGENASLDRAYLEGTLYFLEENREMALLREKERKKFRDISIYHACSLEGLTSLEVKNGDFGPTHLESSLKEAITAMYRQIEREDDLEYFPGPPKARRSIFDLHTDTIASVRSLLENPSSSEFSIQRKITFSSVLGEIQQAGKKAVNPRGEPLQDIIVCASLLERIPNLAGLARTCEIFAASKLVIPKLGIIKDALFESISSSAAQWINMEEVRDVDTASYLGKCKKEGYTIVGLEQTSTSQCLSKVRLPRKIVLLLGREKEGVPVELLAEVDLLVQIPQLGLVRSLNVHVSASLMIWEYTRQHRLTEGNI